MYGEGMTPSEIALKAVEKIETHGWTQFKVGNAATGYCLAGAMCTVVGGVDLWTGDNPYWRLVDWLDKKYGNIIDWNDQSDRTKEDVVLALKEAAVALQRENSDGRE